MARAITNIGKFLSATPNPALTSSSAAITVTGRRNCEFMVFGLKWEVSIFVHSQSV